MNERRFLAFDFVAVVLFVFFGRETHDQTNALGEIAGTAAPFLVALLGAWWASGALRRPTSLRTGLLVGVLTAVVGALVRRYIFGDGIANPFVFVATAFLVAFTLGWRLVLKWVARSRPTLA
jgi:hypothetical protein